MTPFPVAAHRAGRADFPHPALGRDHAFAHGKLVVRTVRRVSPYSCRSRSSENRAYPRLSLCHCRLPPRILSHHRSRAYRDLGCSFSHFVPRVLVPGSPRRFPGASVAGTCRAPARRRPDTRSPTDCESPVAGRSLVGRPRGRWHRGSGGGERRRGRWPARSCQEKRGVLAEQFSSREQDAFRVPHLADRIAAAAFHGQAVRTVAYLASTS